MKIRVKKTVATKHSKKIVKKGIYQVRDEGRPIVNGIALKDNEYEVVRDDG